MNWVRITAAENIPPREGRAVQVSGLQVAIFNTGEGFLAVENRCPHAGGPLADGIVGGTTVTCPLHNWRVCLESGAVERPCDSGAPPVATFPVEVVDSIVMLALDDRGAGFSPRRTSVLPAAAPVKSGAQAEACPTL